MYSFSFSGGLRARHFSLKSTLSREILQRARCIMYAHLALQGTLFANRTRFRFRYADPNNKVTSPLPDILYDAECTRLLEAASADSRTYLLILLLLETGIKTEELMNLELSHIDTSKGFGY
jgi:integrase